MFIDDVPNDPLDKWRPEPAEHARAGELWEQMQDDDRRFCDAFEAACDDVLRQRNLPRMWAAIFLHGRDLIEGNCADRKLARLRLAGAVKSAREEAIKESLYRDYNDD